MTIRLTRIAAAELPGWGADDHGMALAAFRRSCREITGPGDGFSRPVRFGGGRGAWAAACAEAAMAEDARIFFERAFRAYRVEDGARPEGLFTGYFEPEVEGSRMPAPGFDVPVYRRPPDLVTFSTAERQETGLDYGRRVDGIAQPYFTRREIEEGALAGNGLELVWLRDWADAFFIHVQGSGRVRFADSSSMRLSYAAKSGHPYTGIGGLLVARGILKPDAMSMQAIRAWMAGHPEEARALMWENRSFIFFRDVELEDPELGALGAQHVQLTPRRSLAVDRSLWMFGTPVWLDTEIPAGRSIPDTVPFRQLLVAQDTGSAIRGAARGDLYCGFGAEAGLVAGQMKSAGAMTVLLPHAVAEELGLP